MTAESIYTADDDGYEESDVTPVIPTSFPCISTTIGAILSTF